MVIAVVALMLGVLLGGFIFIPRTRKSVQIGKEAHLNASGNKISGSGDQLQYIKRTMNEDASKTFSKAEVASHNKRTDCWIIIKEKVYDVTSYVEEHPGGDAILAHAGDDSTEGFFGPQHATRVFDMIDDFYIGDLEQ